MLLGLVLTISLGCEEEVTNPTFADDAVPRIFGWPEGGEFYANIEDTFGINVNISPSDGATFQWLLNGQVVADSKTFQVVFDTAGTFTIKYMVNRNGVENSRQGVLTVTDPEAGQFTPKTYNKKMVGFLTRNGTMQNVDLSSLTHLVISSAVVGEVEGQEALVDTMFTTLNIPNIVQSAHNAGVYVMLDVSGSLVDINGGGFYGDMAFYNVIADPDKRDLAISTFMKFAVDNGLDGINIYLNNTSLGPGTLDLDVLTEFFTQLPTYFPDGENEFLYAASVPGGWTTSALSPIATIEAIDWVNIQPYRYEALSPGDHSPAWAVNDLAATWINLGLPAEKIVAGFPAFGLKYAMPTDGTEVGWGNLWQFTAYIPFKNILQLDEEAHTKNMIAVDDGIFYDGHAKITEKANAVINSGFGGLMMWSLESDTRAEGQSLLKHAYTALGNE